MSRIVAPDSMKLRTVAVRVEKSVEECTPPSEKESGVRLRMAMMCVGRVGLVECNGGKFVEICVVATGVGSGGGRDFR